MQLRPPSRLRLRFRSRLVLSWPCVLGVFSIPILAGASRAAFSFPSTPSWQSSPQGYVSTGCALRDLNADGYPDLIVANGNDIERQPLVVYLNQGGTYPLTPTWVSADLDYCGHLDLADVDGDGKLDCAVAVYLGPSGFGDPGMVKLYHGNGDGTFSSLPVWTSQDRFYCFSVSFGDVNMDGRPDLACATGESYDRHPEHFRVYRNVGGTLEPLPYWQSAGVRYALDVTWGDVNGDGILDAAFACESNPNDPAPYPSEVYLGNGTTLSTLPGWQNQDGHDYSNTIALGDLNGDGWCDLAIADNNQLHGGSEYGRTKLFLNDGHGNLSPLPSWTSAWSGYGSHVSFVDADHDGDLDLAAGSWWGPVRLYANTGGVLPANPTWQSNTGSVIENIAWEDVDNDGLESPLVSNFAGNGTRKEFVLPDRPVRIQQVAVNGSLQGPTDFFASAEQGWLTLATAPPPGATVRVQYASSADLDFAVSNWDSDIGNYVFLNGANPSLVEQPSGDASLALTVVPNPAPGACRILLGSGFEAGAPVEIFGSDGARIRVFLSGSSGGAGSLAWDGRDALGRPAPSGTYWVRAGVGGRVTTRRLVIVH